MKGMWPFTRDEFIMDVILLQLCEICVLEIYTVLEFYIGSSWLHVHNEIAGRSVKSEGSCITVDTI